MDDPTRVSDWAVFVEKEGLPLKARRCSMKEFDFYGLKIAKALQEWVDKPKGCLYLYGGPGSGKTYAAVCILKEWFWQHRWVRCLKASLVTELGRQRGSQNLTEVYAECDLLLLDDLGVDVPADWEQRYLYDLLDYRCERRELPTIITTNCPKNKLDSSVGARIISRLEGRDVDFGDLGFR